MSVFPQFRYAIEVPHSTTMLLAPRDGHSLFVDRIRGYKDVVNEPSVYHTQLYGAAVMALWSMNDGNEIREVFGIEKRDDNFLKFSKRLFQMSLPKNPSLTPYEKVVNYLLIANVNLGDEVMVQCLSGAYTIWVQNGMGIFFMKEEYS